MGYRNLSECVADLERQGQLIRVPHEVDPYLELAQIQRRAYQAKSPALLLERVRGTSFAVLANLYGTRERVDLLFRDAKAAVKRLVELKADPGRALRNPLGLLDVPRSLWSARPKRVRKAPILEHQTTIDRLPHIQCWPMDGGAFVTLPIVYTEHPHHPGWMRSNLGMYRVQLSGGQYEPNRQVGMHYQIHRGIGVHHAAAIEKGERLRVNVLVGGPPALAVSAVMPLPEGVPELAFAGALGRRRVRLVQTADALPIVADADFCISGTIEPGLLLPEGPFGDHLGYYSLAHEFPVLRVDRVWHRAGAIWPFTSVGRPPQEDTNFGEFVHDLTGPAIPAVVPGVHAVHAVDAAGVHPLLLAIGSERYVPYGERRRPQELLTSANAILGQGQMSLAKYLFIVAREDDPDLDIHDIPAFLRHLLERIDWARDVHFQTCTTIDTLDYSGTGFNEGSKVIWAAVGPRRRNLATRMPGDLPVPDGFGDARLALPGVLVVQAPPFQGGHEVEPAVTRFCSLFAPPDSSIALVVLVDRVAEAAGSVNDWLWVTFTRSNPSADIHGVGERSFQKHWGCEGPLVIDARRKPHHAPVLEEDPEVTRRVDRLAEPGGPLHGIL